MSNFRQRVVLIHKLGQLGGTEEFLHGSLHRLDVDQSLRRNLLGCIVRGHSLANHALQSGQTDAVLVLKKLSDAADTAVAQMVDIIIRTDAVLQMHVVVDGSQNVFLRNVLRNQLADASAKCLCKSLRILVVLVLKQDLTECRIVNLLCDAELFRITVHEVSDVHHQVGQNLHAVSGICLNPHIRDGRILNLICHLTGDGIPGTSENISVCLIDNILCQNVSGNAVAKRQLLVEFIAANLCKVISSGIEEHGIDQAVCALHGKRLTGTNLLVQLKQTLLVGMSGVLGKAAAKLRLVAEHIQNLFIGSNAECTDQNGYRNLSGAVYADIENIIGIRLILQPCTAVRNDRAGIQLLAVLILVNSVVDTRGTNQLGNDNTLCTVDHKGSGSGHQREVTHEDFLLLDFLLVLLVIQTNARAKRCRIGRVTFSALCNGILNLILAETISYEGE